MEGYRKDIDNKYTGEKIEIEETDPIAKAQNGTLGEEKEAPVSTSKYGDPNAPTGMASLQHLAAGKIDRRFYGHYLPEHFKKTKIISTHGGV